MYGYMNPIFEIVIPFKFERVEGFIGKYVAVKYNEKDAVINQKGKIYYCSDLKTK